MEPLLVPNPPGWAGNVLPGWKVDAPPVPPLAPPVLGVPVPVLGLVFFGLTGWALQENARHPIKAIEQDQGSIFWILDMSTPEKYVEGPQTIV